MGWVVIGCVILCVACLVLLAIVKDTRDLFEDL